MEQYLSFAYLFTVGNGLVISILLFLRRGIAGRLFSSLVLCCSLEIFLQYVWRTDPGLPGIDCLSAVRNGICFLYGPILYSYFRSISGKFVLLRVGNIIHIVPSFTVLAASLGGITLNNHMPYNGSSAMSETVFYSGAFISLSLYFIVTLKLIISEPEFRSKWKISLAGYCLVAMTVVLIATVLHISGSSRIYGFTHCLSACLAFPVYLNGYVSLVRHDRYEFIHRDSNVCSCPIRNTDVKYTRNRLSETKRDEILSEILLYLDTDKPYLDSDMTLERFSDHIGIHPHHVSQVINDRLSMNFQQLMNSRRVEESRRILSVKKEPMCNILSVAYDSGFNSKSTFNSVFKKLSGITPSEYRKRFCG